MALSYSIVKKGVAGNIRRNLVNVTVGAAGDYSSGITLDPKSCGLLSSIHSVEVAGSSGAANLVAWTWDISTSKLRAYKGAGSAVFTEAAGSDVATGVVRIEVAEYANG